MQSVYKLLFPHQAIGKESEYKTNSQKNPLNDGIVELHLGKRNFMDKVQRKKPQGQNQQERNSHTGYKKFKALINHRSTPAPGLWVPE